MSSSRILITFATHAGSTAEVAKTIGEVLTAKGAAVDVRSVAEVTDLDSCQAVVIGSPIHYGEWLAAATAFVDAHKTTLSRIPTACFTLALRLRETDDATGRSVETILHPIRLQIKPVSIGLFAGAMDYSKLSAITRLAAQSKGLPEGDFRDWDAIRTWVEALPPLLLGGMAGS